MREAVIVSAARTPIGRAFRGAFNQTPGATLAGHVVRHAMDRAGIAPGRSRRRRHRFRLARRRDRQQHRPHRRAACRLPGHGLRFHRQPFLRVRPRCDRRGREARHRGRRQRHRCGRRRVGHDGAERHQPEASITEEWLLRHAPDVYMPMLYTADNVAKKYASRASAKTSTRCRASSAPPQRKPPAASMRKSFRCPRGNTTRTRSRAPSPKSASS